MNGIEQIRKANELSKVLRTHGLAQDSFDAIKQAHKLANKETNAVLEVNPSSIKQEITESSPSKSQISDSINHKLQSFERSKHLLNERMDKFSIMFEQLQEENKQLRARLEATESKLKFLSRGQGAASSATNPPVTTAPASSHNLETPNQARGHTAAQNSAPPANSSSANASNASRAGYGGIDPNAVSIENIFYCGTK